LARDWIAIGFDFTFFSAPILDLTLIGSINIAQIRFGFGFQTPEEIELPIHKDLGREKGGGRSQRIFGEVRNKYGSVNRLVLFVWLFRTVFEDPDFHADIE
jgi:hypothetical protein